MKDSPKVEVLPLPMGYEARCDRALEILQDIKSIVISYPRVAVGFPDFSKELEYALERLKDCIRGGEGPHLSGKNPSGTFSKI